MSCCLVYNPQRRRLQTLRFPRASWIEFLSLLVLLLSFFLEQWIHLNSRAFLCVCMSECVCICVCVHVCVCVMQGWWQKDKPVLSGFHLNEYNYAAYLSTWMKGKAERKYNFSSHLTNNCAVYLCPCSHSCVSVCAKIWSPGPWILSSCSYNTCTCQLSSLQKDWDSVSFE